MSEECKHEKTHWETRESCIDIEDINYHDVEVCDICGEELY